MSVNIAFYNNKGGVSKTISAANVAAGLAKRDNKVLMIDLDPQGNLSQHFGLDEDVCTASLYDVLYSDYNVFTLIEPILPNLCILPSNSELYGLDFELHLKNNHAALKQLVGFYLSSQYDFIIIDCPGFLNMLSINAMVASDYLMIPANADVFSLNGIDVLLQLLNDVKKKVATRMKIMGIFLTKIEEGNISNGAQKLLKTHFPDLYFDQVIRKDPAIALAPIKGLDVFRYSPDSQGAKDYAALIDVILAKLGNNHQIAFA